MDSDMESARSLLCLSEAQIAADVRGSMLLSMPLWEAVLPRIRHRGSCSRAHAKLHTGRSHT